MSIDRPYKIFRMIACNNLARNNSSNFLSVSWSSLVYHLVFPTCCLPLYPRVKLDSPFPALPACACSASASYFSAGFQHTLHTSPLILAHLDTPDVASTWHAWSFLVVLLEPSLPVVGFSSLNSWGWLQQ